MSAAVDVGHHVVEAMKLSFQSATEIAEEISTVVPATAGHRWFRGKVALRGRWPLVTGNGHMRHYVK